MDWQKPFWASMALNFFLVLLLFLGGGRVQDTPVPGETPVPTGTQEPVQETLQPSATEPTVAPTPVPPTWGENLLDNSSFEGAYSPYPFDDRSGDIVRFSEVTMPNQWHPFFCDFPIMEGACPAELRDSQSPARPGYNDPALKTKRPECVPALPSVDPRRVRTGGGAIHCFTVWGVNRMGVYQTFATIPGETYRAGAYVMSWSANEYDNALSVFPNEESKQNHQWRVLIDPEGGTDAYADDLLSSRAYSYDHGVYDRWAPIEYEFVAESNRATVFIEVLSLYPVRYNDYYIDDAFAQQLVTGEGTVEDTPAPTQTPMPTQQPQPTEEPGGVVFPTPTPRVPSSVTPTPNTGVIEVTPLGGAQCTHGADVSAEDWIAEALATNDMNLVVRVAPEIPRINPYSNVIEGLFVPPGAFGFSVLCHYNPRDGELWYYVEGIVNVPGYNAWISGWVNAVLDGEVSMRITNA